jgi:hypothetical protein
VLLPGEGRPAIAAGELARPVEDYIAKIEIYPGRFMQNSGDPSVKEIKGFGSNFENSLKIVEKSEKCKTNFVGFVVKKSTFSRKHV